MKFRILATVFALAVLFVLFLLFAGGSETSTPTEGAAPISLDGF